MKAVILSSVLLLAMSGSSFGDDYENYQMRIDWNKKSTLSDSVVHQCDDSYYPEIELIVPGKPVKDFRVEMAADVSTGTPDLGCSMRIKKGKTSTTYIFKAESGCSITVRKNRDSFRDPVLEATLEIGDAC